MKVKLLAGRATADRTDPPGAVIDLEDDEAVRYINDGLAEAVKAAKKETATK